MSTSTGIARTQASESHSGGSDTARRFNPPRIDFASFRPQHFLWQRDGKVATVTLNRPERKNPLTMESYAELRDMFRDLVYADDIKSVVISGEIGRAHV